MIMQVLRVTHTTWANTINRAIISNLYRVFKHGANRLVRNQINMSENTKPTIGVILVILIKHCFNGLFAISVRIVGCTSL